MNLSRGLVGYWTMDSVDDVVRDISPYNNHGSMVNSPKIVEGVVGDNALEFDQENQDYLEMTGVPNLGGEFAICFWVTPQDDGTQHRLIELYGNNRTAIRPQTDNDLRLVHYTEEEQIGANFDDAVEWETKQHFVIILENETYKLYKNGDLYEEVPADGADSTDDHGSNDRISCIGWTSPGSDDYSTSVLDDIRIYNRTLMEKEIKVLYNMRKRRSQSDSLGEGLIGHWTNNVRDTSSAIHRDRSGRSNHGDIIGDPDASEGVIDQSYKFGGSEDQDAIEASNVGFRGEFVNGFSISHWVYLPVDFREGNMTDYPTSASNFSSSGSSRSYSGFKNSGNIRFAVGSSEENEWYRISYGDYDLETWMHIVGVWRPDGVLEIWRDGELVESGDTENFIPKVFDKFGIGGNSEDEQWIRARIEDVKWYKRDISEREVKKLHRIRDRR